MKERPLWQRKYVWLPAVLTIYFLFMAIYFGRDMLAAGQTGTYIGIVIGEVAVLTLLVIFLRKRDKIR